MRGHIVKRYKNSYTIVLNLGRDRATDKSKPNAGDSERARIRLEDTTRKL